MGQIPNADVTTLQARPNKLLCGIKITTRNWKEKKHNTDRKETQFKSNNKPQQVYCRDSK